MDEDRKIKWAWVEVGKAGSKISGLKEEITILKRIIKEKEDAISIISEETEGAMRVIAPGRRRRKKKNTKRQ